MTIEPASVKRAIVAAAAGVLLGLLAPVASADGHGHHQRAYRDAPRHDHRATWRASTRRHGDRFDARYPARAREYRRPGSREFRRFSGRHRAYRPHRGYRYIVPRPVIYGWPVYAAPVYGTSISVWFDGIGFRYSEPWHW